MYTSPALCATTSLYHMYLFMTVNRNHWCLIVRYSLRCKLARTQWKTHVSDVLEVFVVFSTTLAPFTHHGMSTVTTGRPPGEDHYVVQRTLTGFLPRPPALSWLIDPPRLPSSQAFYTVTHIPSNHQDFWQFSVDRFTRVEVGMVFWELYRRQCVFFSRWTVTREIERDESAFPNPKGPSSFMEVHRCSKMFADDPVHNK